MTRPKTALVTGGSKRVGRAIVERLNAAGFRVVFTYNEGKAAADDLVAALAKQPREPAQAFQVDLAAPDAADRLANVVRLSFGGGLDLLVNNASLYLPDDGVNGASGGLQHKLLSVNAVAPALTMAQLTPALRAAEGCVVNFLDLLAGQPMPSYSAYCASKAALHATTLAFARKLAPAVRVNGIAPGVIDWPADMPEPARQAYLKRVPLGRAGTPQDAADMVLWLATAAPYVTGQVIRLDGGRSLT